VALELAPAHHPGDEDVVEAVCRAAGMEFQGFGQDGAGLFAEGGGVFVAQQGQGREFAGPGLAEVDDQIPFGDLLGHQLIEGFLVCVDVEGGLQIFRDEADFGHQILHSLPGAFAGVVITEGEPTARLQHPKSLGHRRFHQCGPI